MSTKPTPEVTERDRQIAYRIDGREMQSEGLAMELGGHEAEQEAYDENEIIVTNVSRIAEILANYRAECVAEATRTFHEEKCDLSNKVDNFDANWEQQQLIIKDLRAQIAESRAECESRESLLQQMLDVAENCDETGYIDGEGFVDIDKLHAKVRAALARTETKETP